MNRRISSRYVNNIVISNHKTYPIVAVIHSQVEDCIKAELEVERGKRGMFS